MVSVLEAKNIKKKILMLAKAPSRGQSSKNPQSSISSSISRLRSRQAPSTLRTNSSLSRSEASILGVGARKRKHKAAPRPSRLNKVQPPSSGVSKPERKVQRRRPAKPGANDVKSEKLLSSLSSLAAALPVSEPDDPRASSSGDGGTGEAAANQTKTIEVNGHKIRVSRPARGLRSRPGAMKRKAKVEKAEKDRFGMNLAILAGLRTEGAGSMDGVISQAGPEFDSISCEEHSQVVDSSEKWKTLRNFIKLTT